jgi:hypothetical protein
MLCKLENLQNPPCIKYLFYPLYVYIKSWRHAKVKLYRAGFWLQFSLLSGRIISFQVKPLLHTIMELHSQEGKWSNWWGRAVGIIVEIQVLCRELRQCSLPGERWEMRYAWGYMGETWRGWGSSSRTMYVVLIWSVIDYSSKAFDSEVWTLLECLDVIQRQGLRICSRAFQTSPVAALQVEMGGICHCRLGDSSWQWIIVSTHRDMGCLILRKGF